MWNMMSANNSLQVDDMSSMLLPHDNLKSSKYQSISSSMHHNFSNDNPNTTLQIDDMSSMLLPHDNIKSSKYQSIPSSGQYGDYDNPNTLRRFYYYNIYDANVNALVSSNERRRKLKKQIDFELFATSANFKEIGSKSSLSSIDTSSSEIRGTSRSRMLPESSAEIHAYFYGYIERAKINAVYLSKKSRQTILCTF